MKSLMNPMNNPHIKNPFRHTLRSLERGQRRSRPNYPSVTAGFFTRVNRMETGITARFFNEKSDRLVRQFIFARLLPSRSRSKYTPHVGVKESMRKGDNMALVC